MNHGWESEVYSSPQNTKMLGCISSISELIHEDKRAKKRCAWIRRRSSKGCYNYIVKELDRGHSRLQGNDLNEPWQFFDTLHTARAWAQHVERCCANPLDFVEPRMDDRETKEMLSSVQRKV